MSIDWRGYDAYFIRYSGTITNVPLSAVGRAAVELFVADLLGLSGAARAGIFGEASPPGACAQTVVRLAPGLSFGRADALGIAQLRSEQLAVRVAKTKFTGSYGFLQSRAQPGDPFGALPAVQQVFAAGRFEDSSGAARCFAILEWAEGPTLEHLYTHTWTQRPLNRPFARRILEAFLLEILLPVWVRSQAGHGVLWDVRAANFVLQGPASPTQGAPLPTPQTRVVLIDTDALGDTQRPRPRSKREAAFSRMRGLTARILDGRTPLPKPRKRKKPPSEAARRAVRAAWDSSGLEPALHGLADQTGSAAEAERALRAFLDAVLQWPESTRTVSWPGTNSGAGSRSKRGVRLEERE